MKIDGVVVLYQPTEENVENILKYAPLLHKLYVLDNSDSVNAALLQRFERASNAVLIPMNGNQGIAKALRVGLEQAIEDGADFCLTMDQDSIFPTERMEDIRKYLAREDIDDYGIIGLNVNHVGAPGLVEVRFLLTSGNFVNVRNYRQTDGFREELFIDSVDFDLNHQFYVIGKKIAYINEISLTHTVGTPVRKNLLFRKITLLNHSPVRCYYRFRNNYVLFREDRKFYREIRQSDKKQYIKILFFEKNKKQKLAMIRLGIRHAKQKKFGKLEEIHE